MQSSIEKTANTKIALKTLPYIRVTMPEKKKHLTLARYERGDYSCHITNR